MKDAKIFKATIGGREVTVETGKYAEQANGSCFVRCGDTVVMVNVTMSETPRPGMDFFPLSVDYEEKMYAMGKIPGGFKSAKAEQATKLSSLPVLSTVRSARCSPREFSTTCA